MEEFLKNDFNPEDFGQGIGDNKPDQEIPQFDIPKNDEKNEKDDIIKINEDNSQNQEKAFRESYDLKHINCFFEKIKLPEVDVNLIPSNAKNNFNEKYKIFFCNNYNQLTNNKCEPGKEICPNCMKNTQKLYGLKPHYLINSEGRVCTYKKDKIYCLGKFSKIEDDNNSNIHIKYSINFTCGHTGQCNSCKSMTEKMEKYFGITLMKKLKNRESKM